MAKIPKELESAILALTQKERDKMLLKLIAKNDLLVDQLYFQLLEDESDLKLRRETIKTKILRFASLCHESPGWMMMDMRGLNGEITHHVKTTKDKYGEIELTLYLLTTFFDKQLPHLEKYTSKSDSLAEYVAKRTEFLMKKLPKINEDYFIEFDAEVNKLLKYVHKYCSAKYALQLNLPKSWDF